MNIFIIGASGQLGRALQAQYPEAKSADIDTLDITDHHTVDDFDWSKVNIILNAAAYTDVDGAETPEGRIVAWNVNAQAVATLARVAVQNDITLVHISTDYVFDGTNTTHTEEEPLSPLSVYGASKAAGDIAAGFVPKHYILRTSWVIGEGRNFVRTMLGLGQTGVSPTVVADQIGRPTFTYELVRAIHHLLTSNAAYGVYNVSNEGEAVSWAVFAQRIFKVAAFEIAVTDTSTADYCAGKTSIARRPLNSLLDLSKMRATGFTPRDWQEDLTVYIADQLH